MTRSIFLRMMVTMGVALSLAACGRDASDQLSSDAMSFFNSQPHSDSFLVTAPSVAQSCDSANIGSALTEEYELNFDHVREFWGQCERVYRCSSQSQRYLQTVAARGQTFRISIFDFHHLPENHRNRNSVGLFLAGGDTVFLHSHRAPLYILCGIALHELYHRYDNQISASQQIESLSIEFPAFYQQALYEGDLRQHHDVAIHEPMVRELEEVRQRMALSALHYGPVLWFFSRIELARQVVAAYRLSGHVSAADIEEFIYNYAPLPIEREGVQNVVEVATDHIYKNIQRD